MPRIFLLTALLLSTLPATAQTTPPAKAQLADLRFLEGRWQGTFQGGPIENYWSAPQGDNLLGSIRMLRDGKATMYEILVIEQTDAGLMLHVKHFRPGLKGVEEKDAADRYNLIELTRERAVFEKVSGGDPLRVIWERRPNRVLAVQRGPQRDGQWAYADLFVFTPMP